MKPARPKAINTPLKPARSKVSNAQAQISTRERLLQQALHEFGMHGFDAVTARNLSANAGVPLSAIPYHFGTMEALYRATLLQVMELIAARLGPAVEIAEAAALNCKPAQAKLVVENLLAEMMRVLVVSEESNAWAKIMMREMQAPSMMIAGFSNDVMFRAHRAICLLISRATGKDQGGGDVALQAFALMGQVMVFRHIQPIVRIRMGWPKLGDYEYQQLRAAIRVNF
jgi:TetR/AcrR family transcriptional regulator, regulator of cefoperazone and chloramphenicol sensitivity